jgi:hypothetical protein
VSSIRRASGKWLVDRAYPERVPRGYAGDAENFLTNGGKWINQLRVE